MNNKDCVNIVMSDYDPDGTYTKNIAASMLSILDNTNTRVNFFLIHDSTLKNELKEKLCQMCSEHDADIIFLKVNVSLIVSKMFSDTDFTIGTLFRLYMIDLIPESVERVIYLDGDIICMCDIRLLWELDLKGHSIGAALDQSSLDNGRDYFNAGVMVMDIKKIKYKYDFRNDNLSFLLENKNTPYLDQDSLNYLFHDDWEKISQKYNMPVRYIMKRYPDRYIETLSWYGKIWHFNNSREKPWNVKIGKIDVIYWKYLNESPFCNNIESFIEYYNAIYEPLENIIVKGNIASRKLFFKRCIKRIVMELYYYIK